MKKWIPIILVLLVLWMIGKCSDTETETKKDYTTEATELIEKLRNPKDEQSLKENYDKAIALSEELKTVKDSSNSFLSAQMELEALVTYKDENIKKELIKMKVIKQFSSWDGSHRNLEKYIKTQMNNPKSYEHVETKYQIKPDGTISIYTQFRGTNAFNGVVVNGAVATADMEGNLLTVNIK